MVHSKQYERIREELETTKPNWMLKYINENVLISKHAKKLVKREVYNMKNFIFCNAGLRRFTMIICKNDKFATRIYNVQSLNHIANTVKNFAKYLGIYDIYIDTRGFGMGVADILHNNSGLTIHKVASSEFEQEVRAAERNNEKLNTVKVSATDYSPVST